jgi:hypothetical protein
MAHGRKSGLTMKYEIVALNPDFLQRLLQGASPSLLTYQLERAYFSPGSGSRCLLVDGQPELAGGIVNQGWRRGEAWLLATPFLRKHLRVSLKAMRELLPQVAHECGFRRVQATCVCGLSSRLFMDLGFEFEGALKKFGPNGETNEMWSRIFEVTE